MSPLHEKTRFERLVETILLVSPEEHRADAARLFDWYSTPEVFNISAPFNDLHLGVAETAFALIEYYFDNGERPTVLNSLKELWRANAPWVQAR